MPVVRDDLPATVVGQHRRRRPTVAGYAQRRTTLHSRSPWESDLDLAPGDLQEPGCAAHLASQPYAVEHKPTPPR